MALIKPGWTHGVVDLATDITTVAPKSVVVRGFYVNTVLSAHACNISDGSTAVFIIPASTAAGTLVEFAGGDGVTFKTSLIIDPDNAGTGNITIIYRDVING